MPMLTAAQSSSSASITVAAPDVVITTRVNGAPTPDLLLGLTSRLGAPGGRVALSLDLRDLASQDATAEVVRDLAAHLAELVDKGLTRVAIVAGERRVSLGIARMLNTYAENLGVEAMCFVDSQDATFWLSQPAHCA